MEDLGSRRAIAGEGFRLCQVDCDVWKTDLQQSGIAPLISAVMSAPHNTSALVPDEALPLSDAAWFLNDVAPHGMHLRAYLRKQFPQLEDVDDIVQETHLRLWQAKRRGKIASAKGYLFTIARNVALGIFRRRRRIEHVPMQDVAESEELFAQGDVAETASLNQEASLAADAIERLPARCREIMVLRLLRGVSHQEIAIQLGLSEQTVRVQVARGIKRCAEYLRQHGVERLDS